MRVTFICNQHFKENIFDKKAKNQHLGWWLLPQTVEQNRNNSSSKGMREIDWDQPRNERVRALYFRIILKGSCTEFEGMLKPRYQEL